MEVVDVALPNVGAEGCEPKRLDPDALGIMFDSVGLVRLPKSGFECEGLAAMVWPALGALDDPKTDVDGV